ncbi:hypothetical protein RHMOL_Rhmol09G0045200 [Rhododendron molle]|uniref:Uncharacterized protein n=1 Tax=Rhododendron molle TaxID=49168 RepID=A0ACC0MBL4_RHOML|nr:hypothetical protein RHMOL_Rhmol09G0045200 [Rhododendron molle]
MTGILGGNGNVDFEVVGGERGDWARWCSLVDCRCIILHLGLRSSISMASSAPGNTFDTLFPPLGLSSSTSASKVGFSGFHKKVSMLSNNSLRCGTIPLLVKDSGPDNANQGISSSVGRVNLLDFLESISVPSSDPLAIKEDDTPTVQQIPFLAVRSVAFKKWADYGLVDVLSNDKGFYFFQFGSEGACRQIVELGPWHFGGRLMVLQIWHPGIEYEKEGLTKLPIWIQLYNVPLQYWTAEGLSYLASSVGKPLYADEMTETMKRISYARICVEVDVNASLPHSVDLFMSSGKMVSIAIKYPWKPVKCGVCKVFGHPDCSHREEQPFVCNDAIPDKGMIAPKGKVWVVKPGGGEAIPNPMVVSELVVSMVALSVRELPCANQFEALQVVDSSVDNTSDGVMGLKVADGCVDSGVLVIKDSLGSDLMGPDPSTSKGVEVDQNGTLPDVLGVGMEDPDALFQALISTELKDSTKPNEGKNLGATKRGRKPKYR